MAFDKVKQEEQKEEVKTEEKKEEKKGAAGSKNVEKLVDEIAKLSVLQLSELVNALQDKLGVSASLPVAATAPLGDTEAQGAEAPIPAGGANQTLVMKEAGANKIAVIRALREINPNLGLKEAKDMTEQVPVEVLKDTKAEDAKIASEKLKAAGATVELK